MLFMFLFIGALLFLHQMNIGQAANFTPSKNIECLSAVIHQVLAVVLPFQCLLNLTSFVQNFSTEHIVRQCAIASIFAQCSSADFKHIRNFFVA